MNGFAELSNLWHTIQAWLFPNLEDELGELDDQHRQFVAICETCSLSQHLAGYRWIGNGCPPKDRLALCKAFIAKAVWDFPTTRGSSTPSATVPRYGVCAAGKRLPRFPARRPSRAPSLSLPRTWNGDGASAFH
jgi:hypothetical protein